MNNFTAFGHDDNDWHETSRPQERSSFPTDADTKILGRRHFYKTYNNFENVAKTSHSPDRAIIPMETSCEEDTVVNPANFDDIMGKEQRKISIKKTRDFVYNGNASVKKFPTLAKHVVLIQSHKRKSLLNLHKRKQSSLKSINSVEKSVQVYGDDKISNDNSSNGDDKRLNDKSSKMKTNILVPAQNKNNHDTRNDSRKNYEDYLNKKSSLMAVQPNVNTLTGDSEVNMSENCVYSVVRDNIVELKPNLETISCGFHAKINQDDQESNNHCIKQVEYSSENVEALDQNQSRINSCQNGYSRFGDQSTAVKQHITDNKVKRHSSSDVILTQVEMERSQKNSDSAHTFNADTNLDETKCDMNKGRISNIDVVDFDGTVHKGVEMEGAVVGSICVMNTSNKLDGRRKVEMRAAKRIAVMILSFVTFSLPHHVIALIVSSRKQISSLEVETILVSSAISTITVAINPLLNLFLNKQLRSAAYALLRRNINTFRRFKMF